MTKPTSTPRVDTYRERQKALGRKSMQYYVTDDEHEYLKQQLKEYRNGEITRYKEALEIIAGRRQPLDNLLGNTEIAIQALNRGEK